MSCTAVHAARSAPQPQARIMYSDLNDGFSIDKGMSKPAEVVGGSEAG